jgi:lipopolysaccharide transport system ATP-binding protein
VLAVGDAAFQQKCMGRVARAASEGRTVLFVSHNMTAVTKLCERAILLSHGRLVASGDVQPVVEKYLQDAVTSDGGIFDLSAHPARNAWHTPIFRELTLRKNGTCGTVFFPNDRVEIELVVEPVAPITLPRVAIAIEDAYGRRITTVASFFGEHLADEISGRTVLRCVIPRLPLGEGRYLISLSIHRRHAGFLDLIDHAAWFTVVWNNNYRNGEPYHPVYGPVLIESTWSIVS